jgi:hypothetical protein
MKKTLGRKSRETVPLIVYSKMQDKLIKIAFDYRLEHFHTTSPYKAHPPLFPYIQIV